MKISELIALLERVRAERGDLEVYVASGAHYDVIVEARHATKEWTTGKSVHLVNSHEKPFTWPEKCTVIYRDGAFPFEVIGTETARLPKEPTP